MTIQTVPRIHGSIFTLLMVGKLYPLLGLSTMALNIDDPLYSDSIFMNGLILFILIVLSTAIATHIRHQHRRFDKGLTASPKTQKTLSARRLISYFPILLALYALAIGVITAFMLEYNYLIIGIINIIAVVWFADRMQKDGIRNPFDVFFLYGKALKSVHIPTRKATQTVYYLKEVAESHHS